MNNNVFLNSVLNTALAKTAIRPTVKVDELHTLESFVPTSRDYINADKMTIKKFNLWFEDLCKQIKDQENISIPTNLTFYDKFKIGMRYKSDLVVWGIACVFEDSVPAGEIGVWWDYIISTNGDLAKAQSRAVRSSRLKDGEYVSVLNHNVFSTARIVLSTFGKDVATEADKNQLKVGCHNGEVKNHHLLNLYWKSC